MYGYAGKLLTVDLSTGQISTEPLNPEYASRYIGGAGLAARYLYDQIDSRTNPLGPENSLLFMTGPLDATGAPSSGRFTVVSRSPLTRLYGEANAGNFFGPDLKKAGYDGIVVRGRSASPVYLLVREDRVELRDAHHLQGQTTYETGDAIRAELGDPTLSVAAIGPAGEHLVKYALILTTNARPGAKKGIAGRCGLGAVMGSKNLKAVAVAPGRHPIPLCDAEAFRRAQLSTVHYMSDDVATLALRQAGTGTGMDLAGILGNVPARYWTVGDFDVEPISGNTMADTILTGHATCHSCLVSCGRRVRRAAGHDLPHAEGPEYETLMALGSLLLNRDLGKIAYVASQCDALGLDSISGGSTIAFAAYLRDEGLLPPSEGFDLQWGNPGQTLEWVRRIAHREGLGDLLAEGTRAFGRHYGAEELAVQVNGLELAFHDPRALSGMALVYVTSPIGASHNQSDYYWVEQFMRPIEDLGIVGTERFANVGKAPNVARHQDWRAVTASLVQCNLPSPPVRDTVAMLAAATGYPVTMENVLTYGERIWNLKRALNLKLGYSARTAEKLPELVLRPLSEGGTEGHVPALEPMLREYYAARDWDWSSGKPSHRKLLDLGMPEIAANLWA